MVREGVEQKAGEVGAALKEREAREETPHAQLMHQLQAALAGGEHPHDDEILAAAHGTEEEERLRGRVRARVTARVRGRMRGRVRGRVRGDVWASVGARVTHSY